MGEMGALAYPDFGGSALDSANGYGRPPSTQTTQQGAIPARGEV